MNIINCHTLSGQPVEFNQDKNGASISVPSKYITPPDTIVLLELDSPVPETKKEEISFTGQGEFAWCINLKPIEGQYEFHWLDR